MISEAAKSISSKEHINKSLTIGKNGESMFVEMLKKHNIPYQLSTKEQNIKEHTDIFVYNKRVDVKGLKKSHIHGEIVIEFKNVQGRSGWCSKESPVEYVAFQMPKCFVILRKDEILEYCRKNVELTYVDKFEDAYKKLYTRKNRKDLMTKLNLDDIEKLGFALVLK